MPGTIDISDKDITPRRAVAESVLRAPTSAIDAIRRNELPKSDPLPTARAAALLAVKETPRLIPHCHPIAVTGVDVDFELCDFAVTITCRVTVLDRTGAEMEALVGASTAALTIYDMNKGICAGASVTETRLLEKEGGRSGHWTAEDQGE
jgi:cyclic pyranopterin phosphate synthase